MSVRNQVQDTGSHRRRVPLQAAVAALLAGLRLGVRRIAAVLGTSANARNGEAEAISIALGS